MSSERLDGPGASLPPWGGSGLTRAIRGDEGSQAGEVLGARRAAS
jgi:hypothetical protein